MRRGIYVQTHHGTIVDVSGAGVLLRGPSGCGKSDLALRLMDRGATLIADDRYLVRSGSRAPVAWAPEELYGLLEVRGLGIQSLPAIKTTRLRLVVDLVSLAEVPRLPESNETEICGHKLPTVRLNAFEPSAPLKIELAVSDPSRIGREDI